MGRDRVVEARHRLGDKAEMLKCESICEDGPGPLFSLDHTDGRSEGEWGLGSKSVGIRGFMSVRTGPYHVVKVR